ncbi:MAG: hypothetical protein Q9224_007345, partial [Gallowayella concinna]
MAVSTQDVPRRSVKDWKETKKDIQVYLRANHQSRNPMDLIAVLTHKEEVHEYNKQLKAYWDKDMKLKEEVNVSYKEASPEITEAVVNIESEIEEFKHTQDSMKDFWFIYPTLLLNMAQDEQFLEDLREEHAKKMKDLDDRIDNIFIELKQSRDRILREVQDQVDIGKYEARVDEYMQDISLGAENLEAQAKKALQEKADAETRLEEAEREKYLLESRLNNELKEVQARLDEEKKKGLDIEQKRARAQALLEDEHVARVALEEKVKKQRAAAEELMDAVMEGQRSKIATKDKEIQELKATEVAKELDKLKDVLEKEKAEKVTAIKDHGLIHTDYETALQMMLHSIAGRDLGES